jgi:sugar lactone lactonase YvrE
MGSRGMLIQFALTLALVFMPYGRIAPPPAQATQANGVIAGRVRDGRGYPVADVFVSTGDYDGVLGCGGCPFGTQTLGDGTYRLEVPPGSYLVYVNTHGRSEHLIPQAYRDVRSWSDISRALVVTVASGQTVTGMDLQLSSGFILSGRLVDAHGQPVRGAGGSLRDPDQRVELGCVFGFGTSPADGRFAVTVPAGSYDLSFGLGSEGHWVRYGIAVSHDVSLGDVVFADAPAPLPVFSPRVLEAGFAVETIVPGAPNTTSDVAVTTSGTIYLAAAHSWTVYRVSLDGAVTAVAPVGVFAVDAASDGNVYGYFAPEGTVYRITPDGQVTKLATVPSTACESSMTVGRPPALDVWVGVNDCSGMSLGQGSLIRVTQTGQIHTMAPSLPFGINGLDFAADGQLYVTIVDELYRVNPANGQRTFIARLPQQSSQHGLVVSPAGDFYISSTARDADRVYRVSASKQVSVFATLPSGLIMGLERLPGGDLIAAMRATGELLRIRPDGSWQIILPGNGLAGPQAMAFSLTGELYACSGESGSIVRIADGRGHHFAEVLSYVMPMGYLAFRPDGDVYFSEAAPGFQPRLVRVSPSGAVREVTRALDFPAGLAFTPSGKLHVAEYESGEVSKVSATGAVTTLASGMNRPMALAADAGGRLYVSAKWCRGDNDCIWQIQPGGSKGIFAELEPGGLRALAFGAGGDLFVTGPAGRQSGVLRIAPDGRASNFAVGYLVAAGLAFDLAGNLYVSDDRDNSITRITGFPKGTLQGRVTAADTGQPIAGATVSITTEGPVILGAQVTTGGDGRYRLEVAPRAYSVVASKPGFASAGREVSIAAGASETVDLALPLPSKLYLPAILRRK